MFLLFCNHGIIFQTNPDLPNLYFSFSFKCQQCLIEKYPLFNLRQVLITYLSELPGFARRLNSEDPLDDLWMEGITNCKIMRKFSELRNVFVSHLDFHDNCPILKFE